MTPLLRKIKLGWQIARLLVSLTCLAAASDAYSQIARAGIDTLPPVIELEELAQGVADATQVFTVQIAEETELADATLYFRRKGQQAFNSEPMSPLGNSGLYTASILTDSTDLRTIEYYVQAVDTTGNRTVSGYAFDPYSRSLSPAPVTRKQRPVLPVEPAPEAAPSQSVLVESTPFYKKRWVQAAFGVVAAGIIASTLRDGGEDSEVVDIEFILE